MNLTTPYEVFNLESIKFIPNQQLKFLYIQPGKKPNTLALLTTIPELSQIQKCEGFFFLNDSMYFLYSDTCESVPITRVTNINKLLRDGFHSNDSHTPFRKPLIYLEEYLDGYRLTYSEPIIPYPNAFNFIQIGQTCHQN